MIRLVLFDIDGTLIASGGAGEKAFGQVCRAEFGVAEGAAGLSFAGRTDPSIVRDFFTQQGIEASAANFQRFFDRYVFHLDHMLGQLQGRVLPGVSNWIRELQNLRQPPLMGLLTGNIILGAQIKLSHFQLWNPFVMGAFGSDHEDRNELARVAHARGNRRLGKQLVGEEILVIGDTPRDIECGRAIGAKVLAVATGGFNLEQLRQDRPAWAVETLEQISVREVCE